MSAVETGQMSAIETGQMSAVETRQIYGIKTGQRPVATVDICLVSAEDVCLVSTADICPVSTADISISIHHSASAFISSAQFWLNPVWDGPAHPSIPILPVSRLFLMHAFGGHIRG